jgi:hypothetical protein
MGEYIVGNLRSIAQITSGLLPHLGVGGAGKLEPIASAFWRSGDDNVYFATSSIRTNHLFISVTSVFNYSITNVLTTIPSLVFNCTK